MRKIIIGIMTALFAVGLFAGCGATEETPEGGGATPAPVETPEETPEPERQRIAVSTTFHPVNEVVRIIGGSRVEISKVVPAGADAHNFEPTIRDMTRLTEASLLFVNGLEMEPWVEKAVETVANPDLAIVVLSDGVDLIRTEDSEAFIDDHDHDHDHDHDYDHDEEGHHDHDHGEFDPHVWLSLDALLIMADNAREALAAISPEDAAYFQGNYDAFEAEVEVLRSTYFPAFEPHRGQAFVTGHAAFAYLTRDLGLVQRAIEGPFQEGEPTPQRLASLIDFVKAQGITVIFLEENASPRVSETLARETGGRTVTINPLESEGDIFDTLAEIYETILESFKE